MQFENVSTEEDFREGRIRMAILWEKEDVARFSDFFKKDMADVVQLISDGEVLGALVSPQLPSDPVQESELDDRDAMWCGALVGALNIDQMNDVLELFQKIRAGEVPLPDGWLKATEDLSQEEPDGHS